MGPLKLTDLIGLDTVKFIADAMYEDFKDAAVRRAAPAAAHGRGRSARQEIRQGFLHVLRFLRLGLSPSKPCSYAFTLASTRSCWRGSLCSAKRAR